MMAFGGESRIGTGGLRRGIIAGLVLLLMALFLDDWAYGHFMWADQDRLERRDWWRLFRIMGYLPTWLAVGAALVLVEGVRRRESREVFAPGVTGLRPRAMLSAGAVATVLSAALAGGTAEVVKLLVGRERPDGSGYVFRPLFSGFADGSGLGFPSSHAAVAFGAAFALAWSFRGSGPVVLLLAAGCGLSRMQAGAHYFSDVVGAAIVGWAAAALVRRFTK